MSEYKLAEEIVRLSKADTWNEAKLEWELEEVYQQDDPDACLCGHFPIIEICVLRNKYNRRKAEVGNVCVKKFLGLPSENIFQGIRRIANDKGKALNAEAVDHAHRRGWINDWEGKFCFDTMRKRSLSDKQLAVRQRINLCVLLHTRRARPGAG